MSHRTRIKICGLTREADVDAAVQAGADAIGFVLYVLCITQPFSLEEQVIFLLILGVIALTLP